VSRVVAAARGLALAVLIGALFGALEGALAESLPGEPWADRVAGLVLLDAVLLGVPLGLVAVALALFRPPREVRPGLTIAALGVLLGLLGSGGWRLAEVLGDLDLDRLQGWHLERPLPMLRSEGLVRPVVLITVDTLRADRVAQMPRLREWAGRGAWFTHARTSSPWTLPALATLHSGLPAGVHGAGRRVQDRPMHVRTALGDVPLLAEGFRRQGYVTGAVVTNPYAGARYGFNRGFDRFHDLTHRTLRQRALRRGRLLRGLVPPAGDTADRVTDRALTMLERGGEGRLFAWVHYLDAHAPYAEVPDGFDPYGTCDLPTCFDDWKAFRAGFFNPGPEERAFVEGLYDADVAWLDGELGRLLDGLEAAGLLERALVVLVGDHGEELWDHGGGEHGATFHDEVVRVPLLVWGPGVTPGQDDRPVGLVAVHEALQAFVASGTLGPLAPGVPAEPVPLISRLFGDEATGCVLGQHKRVVEGDETVRFYDLAADPKEAQPLAQVPPHLAEALAACTPAPLEAASAAAGVEDAAVLQALGYVE
jgi:hypothetical protein